MQFMTLSRSRTEQFSDVDFAARVQAEVAQARVLYAQGFIRQIWHRGDMSIIPLKPYAGFCLPAEAPSAQVGL
jgi:muconolactone delta-isomerase